MSGKVKFGMFTDLHVDIMHDTEQRLAAFIDAARKENVDFIIQLGDFCYPDEGRKCICKPENLPVNLKNALEQPSLANKDAIRALYRDFEKPSYHVIGNHDCDMCSKRQVLDYHGVKSEAYYSFDFGDFHFVVLDANYFMEDGEYFSYENGNYFDKTPGKTRTLPYLPPRELDWLSADLDSTEKPTVIFSHQSLRKNAARAILNASDFKKAIKRRRSKVVACFSGHTHLDGVVREEDVWYMHVNSMSNHWLGEDFQQKRKRNPPLPFLFSIAGTFSALFRLYQQTRFSQRSAVT